jgi:hypothetical protein
MLSKLQRGVFRCIIEYEDPQNEEFHRITKAIFMPENLQRFINCPVPRSTFDIQVPCESNISYDNPIVSLTHIQEYMAVDNLEENKFQINFQKEQFAN